MKRLVLIGAGGHAAVLLDAIPEGRMGDIVVCVQENSVVHPLLNAFPHIPEKEALALAPGSVDVVNAIGSTGPGGQRAIVDARFHARGHRFLSLVHAAAIVSSRAELSDGCQVMAGAVVQAGAQVSDGVIVNTNAVVDHDTRIGSLAHVASGAVLAGSVDVGQRAFVGAGAVVIQGVRIGPGALVAAGALVIRDVEPGTRVAGIPARPMIWTK